MTTAISRFIGLSRGIILTWLILHESFGALQIAISYTTVMMPFCCAGLTEGIFRFAPRYENTNQWRAFLRRAAAIATIVAAATTGLLAAASGWIGPWLLQSRLGESVESAAETSSQAGAQSLFLAILLCTLSLVLHHFIQNIHKALRNFRILGMMEIVAAAVFTLFALLLAVTPYANAVNLLHCYTLGSLSSAVIFAVPVFYMTADAPTEQPTGQESPPALITSAALIRYSIYSAVALVTLQALNYSPFWYLNKAIGPAAAGSLYAVRLITQFIQILSVLLTGVVSSHVTKIWESETRDAARARLKLATKSSLLIILLFGGLLSIARPLLMQVFPDTYAGGSRGFDPLISFFLLGSVVYLLVVNLSLLERTDLTVIIWGVGAVVNLALSAWLLNAAGQGNVPTDPGRFIQLAAWAGVGGMTASVMAVVFILKQCDAWLDSAILWIALLALAPNLGTWFTAGVVVLVLIAPLAPVGLYGRAERIAVRRELKTYMSAIARFLRRSAKHRK